MKFPWRTLYFATFVLPKATVIIFILKFLGPSYAQKTRRTTKIISWHSNWCGLFKMSFCDQSVYPQTKCLSGFSMKPKLYIQWKASAEFGLHVHLAWFARATKNRKTVQHTRAKKHEFPAKRLTPGSWPFLLLQAHCNKLSCGTCVEKITLTRKCRRKSQCTAFFEHSSIFFHIHFSRKPSLEGCGHNVKKSVVFMNKNVKQKA